MTKLEMAQRFQDYREQDVICQVSHAAELLGDYHRKLQRLAEEMTNGDADVSNHALRAINELENLARNFNFRHQAQTIADYEKAKAETKKYLSQLD